MLAFPVDAYDKISVDAGTVWVDFEHGLPIKASIVNDTGTQMLATLYRIRSLDGYSNFWATFSNGPYEPTNQCIIPENSHASITITYEEIWQDASDGVVVRLRTRQPDNLDLSHPDLPAWGTEYEVAIKPSWLRPKRAIFPRGFYTALKFGVGVLVCTCGLFKSWY
jgi:hypothetical protein